MATEYTPGDIDLKMNIISEKNVTIEFVVSEATQIYRKMRSRKLKFGDMDAADALMNELQKEHPEFSKSYPIVLRYICQMQEYDRVAFKIWLMKIKERPWKTEVEYLDAQADYITILFKKKKPRSNRTEINNLRTNVRAMLQREHDMFKQYAQEFDKEVSAEETTLKSRNVEELRDFARAAGAAGMSLAETIRVESDMKTGTPDIDIESLANTFSSTNTSDTADELLA